MKDKLQPTVARGAGEPSAALYLAPGRLPGLRADDGDAAHDLLALRQDIRRPRGGRTRTTGAAAAHTCKTFAEKRELGRRRRRRRRRSDHYLRRE